MTTHTQHPARSAVGEVAQAIHRGFHDAWPGPSHPLDLYVTSPVWESAATAVKNLGALCSQCGEQPGAMLKLGTEDVWCLTCLDEAADTALRERIEALADRWAARAPVHYTTAAHAEVRCERELRAALTQALTQAPADASEGASGAVVGEGEGL